MKSRLYRVSKYLLIAGLAVLAIGLSATGFSLSKNSSAKKTVTQSVQKQVSNSSIVTAAITLPPSTDKITPSAYDRYTVAADLPRYILIPKIGVQAIVEQLGVTTTNQLESPSNIYQAGWYTGSAKPGQPGAMVIDGHVASWSTQGVFYNLSSLKAGDKIAIERGDGTILNYEVVKTQVWNVADVDMQAVQQPINPTKPGLNLITCTGSVTPETSEFNQRLVIFAEQI